MTASAPLPDRQACLFDTLPETEPRRRRGRQPPKPPVESTEADVPTAPTTPTAPTAVTPLPVIAPPSAEAYRPTEPFRLDASALSHPDLSDLVTALTDSSLGFLLITVVHEAKRRLTPDETSDAEDPASTAGKPNPQLLRALRTVMMELIEQ